MRGVRAQRIVRALVATVALSGGVTVATSVATAVAPAGASNCGPNSSGTFSAGNSTIAITPGTNGTSTTGLPGGCSPLKQYVTDTVNGTTATITVTIKDTSGNPVTGQVVQINPASASSASVTTVTGTTGADGKATFTMTDLVHETVTYTASDITACTDNARDGCVYGGSYNGSTDTSANDDGELATAMQITFAAGYTLAYDLNGGTGTTPTDATVYAAGASVTLASADGVTAPEGCQSFLGWSNNANYPTVGTLFTVPGTSTITATTTLYAVWDCTTFHVDYFGNGGAGTPPTDANGYPDANPATIADGSSLTPPNGCTFAGWSTDPAATTPDPTYAPGSQVTVTANLALYAVYSCSTVSVTYDANGGNGTAPTDPKAYAAGDTVTVLGGSNLTAGGGCIFIGWDPSSTATTPTYPSTQTSTFEITTSTTLYAVYGRCGWDVTYDAGDGTGSVTDANSPYTDGSTVTILGGAGLVAPTGQEFLGWATTSSASTPDVVVGGTFTIHADTVLYAVYAVTVRFDAGTGSGTMDPHTAIVPGDSVTLPSTQGTLVAPPNQQFDGWNCDGTPYAAGASITVDADTTCTAQWAPIPVTLTFNPGTGTGSIPSQGFNQGDTVTLPSDQGAFVAPANQAFSGWSCSATVVPPAAPRFTPPTTYAPGATFTIAASTTCTALWAPIPVTLVVTTNGHGIASVGGVQFVTSGPGHSSTTHDLGSSVAVVAAPRDGFGVVWGGACAHTTGTTCIVAMTQSRSVTIRFVPNVVLPVFFFAVNQWSIHLSAHTIAWLEHDLTVLAMAGVHRLTLTGYADLRASVGYNYFLGAHRSAAAEAYLNAVAAKLGIPHFTFTLRDGGETAQFGSSYWLNRRTVVSYTV